MERLVRIVVPKNKLADDVDFNIVCAEMTGFLPAFVRAAADRAKSFALHRAGGASNYLLTTGDLVNAARSLHPQLKLHQEALEVPATPTLDNVMRGLVTEGVTGMKAMSSSFPTLVMKPPSTLRRRS
jgi:transitional endoplasmic reticulum ATPase